MPNDLQNTIAVLAIGFSFVSFLAYLALTLGFAKTPGGGAAEDVRQAVRTQAQVQGASPAQVAELVKALATLAESLAKAGPALWSLIGSILFLLIAAVAAGVLQGDAASGDAAAAAKTPPAQTQAGA
jgi:hypothetical protein